MKCSLSVKERRNLFCNLTDILVDYRKRAIKKGPEAYHPKRKLLIGLLEKEGFVFLNYGGSRFVFQIPERKDLVLKIDFLCDSNYSEWIWYKRISPKNKKYFSKLYDHSEDFMLMICERLYPLPENFEQLIESEKKMGQLVRKKRWRIDDIHSGNIMYRITPKKRKTLVFCDFEF